MLAAPPARAQGLESSRAASAEYIAGSIADEKSRGGDAPPCEAQSELDPLLLALCPPMSPLPPVAADAPLDSSGVKGGACAQAAEAALVEQVVRRVVWGGDRRRGVARIELDGDFAGTTIWVRGEGRDVALEVDLGPALSSRALPERLVERLRARGIEFTSVVVR